MVATTLFCAPVAGGEGGGAAVSTAVMFRLGNAQLAGELKGVIEANTAAKRD